MHDLPRGPDLLALARAVLLDELLPLLPAERRIDALLVANCLAIAGREAAAKAPSMTAAGELARLYRSKGPPAARAPEEMRRLWRRFAGDLRRGAFEGSAERERGARMILWRLTLDKLRLANPRYLNANGLAETRPTGE
jgi:hypothetical protein